MEPIKILLSEKQKTFSECFFEFSKSRLNFQHFRKTRFDNCLKSPVSENSSTINVVTGPNTVEISTIAPLQYFLIMMKAIEAKKSLS